MFFDWEKEFRCLLEEITIHYLGSRYEGTGAMTWKPSEGFHIQGRLSRFGPPLPPIREYGLSTAGAEDLRCIRLRVDRHYRGLIPAFRMCANHAIIENGDLNVIAGTGLFCDNVKFPVAELSGAALLAVGDYVPLPHGIERSIKVMDEQVEAGGRAGALAYEASDVRIYAWPARDEFMRVSWQLDPRCWSRGEAWRFAEAVELVISIISGFDAHLLSRRLSRGMSTFYEFRRKTEVDALRILRPFGYRYWAPDEVVNVIGVLASHSRVALVCKKIFRQLVEASRQRTAPAAELLCASILEASLRTIEGLPVSESDRGWNVDGALNRFRSKYLGREWKPACKRVLEAFRSLRLKNAHPDWLIDELPSPREVILRSAGEMRTLAWFYGQMILALVGHRPIDPAVPSGLESPHCFSHGKPRTERHLPRKRTMWFELESAPDGQK